MDLRGESNKKVLPFSGSTFCLGLRALIRSSKQL